MDINSINLLLTDHEVSYSSGEYWLKVGAVRIKCSELRLITWALYYMYMLLTKREGHPGRISAQGLESTEKSKTNMNILVVVTTTYIRTLSMDTNQVPF